ncbi:DegV family protein [Vagococcus intermedius]|uniref:DegV family protein n=1 Tax=Vagococcus intermedius TaxID=2991418 RepID=A0AAF0IAA0_9ENTE|nr:DegV family protein [Vagococcus intermedius]WEG74282.1 DegV family protein [Vagococcus intermedius]WEG76365.1 DegV family protein [Vagococcus intermedius]
MSKVKIVTDSSCNMEPGLAEKLNIEVISLSVMIDDVIYKDTDISGSQFMTMMENAAALPKTSQPPIGEFVQLYDELGADGSSIISIHMTDLISGTVNTAAQAAQLSTSDVTVINSTFTDQGLSFQVIEAAKMALDGLSKETIIEKVQEIKKNSLLYIGVASLDNMVKGGRLSRATGVLTNLFNIRVVMQLLDSELVTLSKGRGAKAFSKWFEELKADLAKMNNVKQVAITHAADIDLANKFKKDLQAMYPDMHIPILDASSIIATHTGKGAFAIMLYTE